MAGSVGEIKGTGDWVTELEALHREIEGCQRCPLGRSRLRAVPGEGAPDAQIMFIGEAPGWHEDQQGRPFVGPAGQFLDELIESIGMRRGEVYITNVIKSRPPDNRDPLPTEVQACKPWLDRQIEIIKPKMIVTLGRYSMARFFPGESISRVHGTARVREGIIYFAMYHPAAALHQGRLRQTIIEDMAKIPTLLAEMERQEGGGRQPQQLPLF